MIVLVTGTGTDVGKTWFTAATIGVLREAGYAVAARKPVQSFEPGDLGSTDAEILARATGEDPEVVCPPHRWLAKAVAPPMAARALGRPPISIAELNTETRALLPPASTDTFVFVEGAGGVRSPIADDGDTLALAHALAADAVIVVSGAELGAINAVRLTVAALGAWSPIVALNRHDAGDALHAENRAWLGDQDGFDVFVSPTAVADELTRRAALPTRS
jgi:dethiobiotin synthetase